MTPELMQAAEDAALIIMIEAAQARDPSALLAHARSCIDAHIESDRSAHAFIAQVAPLPPPGADLDALQSIFKAKVIEIVERLSAQTTVKTANTIHHEATLAVMRAWRSAPATT